MIKGDWIYYEKLDNWHLILAEITRDGPDGEPVLTFQSWCSIEFDKDAPRKPGAQLHQWADAVHDDCLRRSEEATRRG